MPGAVEWCVYHYATWEVCEFINPNPNPKATSSYFKLLKATLSCFNALIWLKLL